MRRAGNCRWVQRHDKADARIREIHFAKIADFGSDIAAKNVQCQLVTKFKSDLGGLFGGKAHQGWSGIVSRPPTAGRQACPLW